jgi:hypothetical protein
MDSSSCLGTPCINIYINDCTGNTKHFAVDNDDGIRSHRIICPLDKWLQAQ